MNSDLPLEAEEFLSWMATERGRSENTLLAYRRRERLCAVAQQAGLNSALRYGWFAGSVRWFEAGERRSTIERGAPIGRNTNDASLLR